MIITEWPLHALTPRHLAVWPEYQTRPDHQATNGMRRSPGLTASAFRLRMVDIPVFNEAKYRTLMAMLASMEGNSNLIRIRVPNFYGIDGPFTEAYAARKSQYPKGVPFASDVMFSDGAGFAVSTLTGSFAQSAALGAKDIYVDAEEEVPGGCIISIDGFTYITAGSWTESGENRVKLSPPLRKAASAGDTIDFAPSFVGACVSTSPGGEERQYGRYGYYSFEFVEDLTRLVESID